MKAGEVQQRVTCVIRASRHQPYTETRRERSPHQSARSLRSYSNNNVLFFIENPAHVKYNLTTYHYHSVYYNAEMEKIRMLEFQQLLMQLGLERMQDMNYLVRHYESDERYRVGFIFCKLRDWVEDMRQYYFATYLYRTTRPVRSHLVYYEMMLRRHIDITYTIEMFAIIHAQFREKLLQTFNLSADEFRKLSALSKLKKG